LEWFSARQPRQWFIDEYKGNNKSYLVNGAQQASIDISDNNIFENKTINTIGFKFCYTFDVVKNYYDATNRDVTTAPSSLSTGESTGSETQENPNTPPKG